MNNKRLNICIGMDDGHRYEMIADALGKEIQDNPSITYQIVDLQRHDWLEIVKPFDMIIWWPTYMGPHPSSLFKEKIYFLEKFLGKLVVPNYNSVWHFESKIAQNYLFNYAGVSIPRTVISFDCKDALEQMDSLGVPFVMKKSFGAASKNVRLIKDKQEARREINSIFYQSLWKEAKDKSDSLFTRVVSSIKNGWFWKKLWVRFTDDTTIGRKYAYAYMQEFIPGNTADLRITVIGDRFAYGYWRNNRPGDFRASGSGRMVYDRPIPEDIVCYCMGISKKLNFDSMAYDIIFKDKKFVITEMSFSYVPKFIHNVSGYFKMDDSDQLAFHSETTWPMELWAKWALIRAGYSEPESVVQV